MGSPCWIIVPGFGNGVRGFEFSGWGSRYGVSGFGLRGWGCRFGVSGMGFGVSVLGCRVQGFGFGVWGSGFRISGQTATYFPVAARRPASSQARPRCVMAGVKLPSPCAKSTVTQVNRGPTFALRRSTLDFCLGGQRCSKSKGNRSPALRTKPNRFRQVLDLDWRSLESGDLWCKKGDWGQRCAALLKRRRCWSG